MMFNLQLTATEADTTPYKPEMLSIIAEHNLAGTTFNNGLLRFLNAPAGAEAEENLREMFGEQAAELTPFAVDWRGRYFCRVMIDGHDMALRADCATDEAATTATYEETLGFLMRSPEANEYLGESEMNEHFEKHGIYGLPFNRCMSMTIPTFLGGEETLDNFEPNTINVHWYVIAQVYHKAKAMPEGTPIQGFYIEEEK